MRKVTSGLARAAILLILISTGPAWGVNAVEMATLASDSPGSLYGFSADVEDDTAIVGALGSTHVLQYQRGRWLERTQLATSGREIEIDGDTVAVLDDASVINVYTGSGSSWTRQARLNVHQMSGAENTNIGSLALAGDTLAVAAVHSTAAGTSDPAERGTVYVFTRNGTSWSLQSQLDIAEARLLSLAADVDGDSLVVAHTGTGPSIDGLDVYQRAGNSWQFQSSLAPGKPAGEKFAAVVAIEDTAIMAKIVGGGVDRVLVYTETAQGWRRDAVLIPQGNQRYAALAKQTQAISDIAMSGDVALIGSAWHSEHGRAAGSAYVFKREGGTWRQHQNILPEGAGHEYGVGIFVKLSGNRAVLGARSRFGPRTPFLYQLFPGQEPHLFCSGNVNGDGDAGLAMVTPEGNVSVKALDRRLLSWFPLHGVGKLADAELVDDTNGNGAPELAVVDERTGAAQLRDLASGGTLGTAAFGSNITPMDLEVLSDSTGNGIPELAALVEYPYAVHIRDAMTGQHIRNLDLGIAEYRIARDLDPLPGVGAGAEALAVIADNWSGGGDKVEIRDSATGGLIREFWFGADSSAFRQEQVRLADLNGNGSPELALLTHTDVEIRDTVSKKVLGRMAFDNTFTPIRLLAIPDKNWNGSDELVLMGKHHRGTVQRASIKDSRTGQNLGQLWFDRNFLPIDLVSCGDINGNGAAELGQRGANGLIKVVVKDSRTMAVLSSVWF